MMSSGSADAGAIPIAPTRDSVGMISRTGALGLFVDDRYRYVGTEEAGPARCPASGRDRRAATACRRRLRPRARVPWSCRRPLQVYPAGGSVFASGAARVDCLAQISQQPVSHRRRDLPTLQTVGAKLRSGPSLTSSARSRRCGVSFPTTLRRCLGRVEILPPADRSSSRFGQKTSSLAPIRLRQEHQWESRASRPAMY